MPAVLADGRIDIRSNEDENYVSINLNTAAEPEGFEGHEARISDDPYLHYLTRAALDHLRSSVPGID